MSIRVAVMFGGRSVEHEISVISGVQCMEAIDTRSYDIVPIYVAQDGRWYTGDVLFDKSFYRRLPSSIENAVPVTLLPHTSGGGFRFLDTMKPLPVDVVFLAFHGTYGEDGCMQGMLELADIPYSSGGVLSSSVTMDKALCKVVLAHYDIPVLPWKEVARKDARLSWEGILTDICSWQPFPLFVKPLSLGSSIAVSRAYDMASLESALAHVFRYDSRAIVEPCIEQLLEANISVVDGDPPRASALEIPVATSSVLTYEDKYLRGGKNKAKHSSGGGMADLVREINPQHLDPSIAEQVTAYALQAFSALHCGGVVRFDFMVDCKDNNIYCNEVNTLPGSFAFYLWEKSQDKLLYPALLDTVIRQALKRRSEEKGVCTTIQFQALKCF